MTASVAQVAQPPTHQSNHQFLQDMYGTPDSEFLPNDGRSGDYRVFRLSLSFFPLKKTVGVVSAVDCHSSPCDLFDGEVVDPVDALPHVPDLDFPPETTEPVYREYRNVASQHYPSGFYQGSPGDWYSPGD